jgi:ABC-type dipeptide/oligopeptide/nickel transport system permease component
MLAFVLRRLGQALLVMLAVGLIALFFVVINMVVDLVYFAVDPRLRIERTAAAH